MSKGVSRVSTTQDVVAEEWAPLSLFPSIVINFRSFSLIFIHFGDLKILENPCWKIVRKSFENFGVICDGSGSNPVPVQPPEPKIGSGSSGSVFKASSTGSSSKTVRFPVPGSVRALPG